MFWMPVFGLPIIQPRAFSNDIVQVHEPLMPILCSIDTHLTGLRSPIEPSALTRYFGTTKVDSPLMPGGESGRRASRSEEHTSELQSLMRISYAVFCLKNKKTNSHRAHAHLHSHSIWKVA